MSIRRVIVEIDTSSINVTEFCEAHGVSTWFFYDLRRRFAKRGEAALEPGSRAPRRVANRTPDDVIDLIVTVRKELTDAGFDAGPASVVDHLAGRLAPDQRLPSEATVYRWLRQRGFIIAEPRKAPKRAERRFVAARGNERWQIDATHGSLTGGGIEIINVIDDCTRVNIASLAVPVCTTEGALNAVTIGAQRWGWPEGILTDNGAPFRGRPGHPGTGGLAAQLAELGIRAGRSRPYHPQTCGKVERFHQTQQRYLDQQPTVDTTAELQAQLDTFSAYYNHQRRHRGIGRAIPAELFASTPRSGPAHRPLDTPTDIYRPTVSGGSIWIGARGRISVGARYNSQPALAIVTGLDAHVFINGHLVRQLELDPTRTNQPLRQTVRDVSRHP